MSIVYWLDNCLISLDMITFYSRQSIPYNRAHANSMVLSFCRTCWIPWCLATCLLHRRLISSNWQCCEIIENANILLCTVYLIQHHRGWLSLLKKHAMSIMSENCYMFWNIIFNWNIQFNSIEKSLLLPIQNRGMQQTSVIQNTIVAVQFVNSFRPSEAYMRR